MVNLVSAGNVREQETMIYNILSIDIVSYVSTNENVQPIKDTNYGWSGATVWVDNNFEA
jgi:hypothetical protein